MYFYLNSEPGTEVKGEKEGEDSNTPKDPNQRTRQ